MFAFDIVSSDMSLQLALSRLGSEALYCYVGLITLSGWDVICLNLCQPLQSPVWRTPCVCLLLLSPLHPPHLTWRAPVWHALWAWETVCRHCRGVSVRLRVKQTHRSRLRAVKILGNYCVAVYCDTKLILCHRTSKLRRKLRCDTTYWQHCDSVDWG